jgi:hypothetical protein
MAAGTVKINVGTDAAAVLRQRLMTTDKQSLHQCQCQHLKMTAIKTSQQ